MGRAKVSNRGVLPLGLPAALLAVLGLGACGTHRFIEAQERMQRAEAEVTAARAAGQYASHVEAERALQRRAQDIGRELAIPLEIYDELLFAYRFAVARRADAGEITDGDARALVIDMKQQIARLRGQERLMDDLPTLREMGVWGPFMQTWFASQRQLVPRLRTPIACHMLRAAITCE